MKKLSILAVLLAATLGLTGCGSDEPDTTEITTTIQGLSTNTLLNNELFCESRNTSVQLHLLIQMTARLDLTIQNVKFAEQMPAVNITLENIEPSIIDSSRGSFTGRGSYTPVAGYTIKNLVGNYDLRNRTIYMSYTVETSSGSYNVVSFPSDMRSAISDEDGNIYTNYDTTTELYYRFIQSANTPTTFDMYMYNIRFTEQMPVQRRLHFPLSGDNVTVKATTTGYTITGTGIVPYYTDGTVEVPMAERTVNNFVLHLNTTTKSFDVEFDCYGLHYNDRGKLL